MQLFYQIVQQASFEKIQFSGEWILLYYLIFELGKQEYLLFPMTLKNFLDEFKSFLGTHHLSYGLTISKQLHTLLRLLVVDSGVKFDRKFEQFNISAECSLSEKIRLDSYNKKMISHYQTVGKKGIVKHQGIRGDGNCYYGAVAYDVLRRLVLYPSDLEFISNTYQQFNRAYDLIEKYYTQEKDSFKESHQLMMRSFFNDDGQFILRFIHDLDRLYFNDEKFYLPMIRTFRMLLADVIEKNKDQAFNDLTLENYINFDQEMEIKQWIECNVLVLGKCAEGAPINLALLPKIFKCAQCILTLHREEPFYETLVPLENATPIILCFTPGHYDLFNTNEMQKNIDTNRYQFYQDKTGGLFKPPVRLSLAYKLDKNWNTSPKILLSAIFLIFKCLANLAFIFVNMCIYLVNFIGLNFPQLDLYQFSTLSLSPC
jgi:hypothetical protein